MTNFQGASSEPTALGVLPALTWETPRGVLRVWSHASSELILSLTIDRGFGLLFRLNRYQDEFLHTAAHPAGNVVLAVAEPDIVVGYILAESPEPVAWQRRVAHNRWAECPAVVELGAIEVSSNYRRLGVAEHLLQALADDQTYQDKIIIGTIMRRYWDLKGSGLNAWQYRASLEALLIRYGFSVFPTDDPRVITEPTDALMARIGPDTPPEAIAQFHRLRLTSTPPQA